MAAVFVELLPLVLGAMLAPAWIIIVLLLLASPRGLVKAAALVTGMTLTRLLQGALFGVVLGASPDAESEGGGPSPVVSTLLMVGGIFLLVTAYRKWRKEEDPDEPPPAWMQQLGGMEPLRALGMGAALMGIAMKQWVFTLSALAVIRGAELGQASAIAAYLAYIVLAQLLLFLAVLGVAVAPRAGLAAVRRASDWLARYNRPITIAVTLIFGVYFTWKGIGGLLA